MAEDDPLASTLDTPAASRVNATFRNGRLVSFLADTSSSPPLTNRTLEDAYYISLEAAVFLAVQDSNARQSRLVPTLTERLNSCDMHFTLEMRDTQFSPYVAVRQYQEGFLNTNSTPTTAVIGSTRSTVTASLATLSSTQGIPQISGLTTAGELNDKSSFPFFARTIPDNKGDSMAACIFLKSLGVKRFALLYVNDFYGVGFFYNLLEAATNLQLEIVSAAYYEDDKYSLDMALNILQNSTLRYFVGVLGFRDIENSLLGIYNHKLLGIPGYTWLFSESVGDIVDSMDSLNGLNLPVGQALNGAGAVLPLAPFNKNAILQSELQRLADDKTRLQQFIQEHVEASVIFPGGFQLDPRASMGALLFYDSVIALGIAACETEYDLFTGPELYQSILRTAFDGASGNVSFVNTTGTRVATEVSYRIFNLLHNKTASNDDSTVIVGFDSVYVNITDQTIEVVRPFVFSDGTTVVPAVAPPVHEELNLIPTTEIVIVSCLVGIVASLSIVCGIWTIYNRRKRAVRASQPIFLVFLCIGTFLLSLAAVFQAFQEPLSQKALNFGCNIYPWFVCIGFTTTFSALFSKTWRINRVYRSAQHFQRVQVSAKDVMWPFAVLFLANTAVLTTGVVLDPSDWRRIPLSININGQITASFGTCFNFDPTEAYVFLALIFLNATALVIANYESFKARNLPSEFNETFYVALTNAILLESSIVGAPVLMLVTKQPAALFLVRSVLLMTASLAVLLPIFVPKMVGMDGGRERRVLRLSQLEI